MIGSSPICILVLHTPRVQITMNEPCRVSLLEPLCMTHADGAIFTWNLMLRSPARQNIIGVSKFLGTYDTYRVGHRAIMNDHRQSNWYQPGQQSQSQAPGDQILILARYLQFYCGDEDHSSCDLELDSSYEWSSIVKKPSHLGCARVFLAGIRPNNAKLSTLVLVCWRSREMNIHSTTAHRWPYLMVFSSIEQPTWFK